MKKIRIAILVGTKGRGSNMRAIIEACQSGRIPGEVVAVFSPKDNTPAVQNAHALGTEVIIVNPDEPDFAVHFLSLVHCMRIDLLCLAGYMRLLPKEIVQAMPGRILNIHPALLPKFGGKGMYGMKVHEAVIASGEKESGCSVHYVTEKYDEGEILLQKKCPVYPEDTSQSLAERILPLEHECYVEAINLWIEKHDE